MTSKKTNKTGKENYYLGRPNDEIDTPLPKNRAPIDIGILAKTPLFIQRIILIGAIYMALVVPIVVWGTHNWAWNTTYRNWTADAERLAISAERTIEDAITRGREALNSVVPEIVIQQNDAAREHLAHLSVLGGFSELHVDKESTVEEAGKPGDPATDGILVKQALGKNNQGLFVQGTLEAARLQKALTGPIETLLILNSDRTVVASNRLGFNLDKVIAFKHEPKSIPLGTIGYWPIEDLVSGSTIISIHHHLAASNGQDNQGGVSRLNGLKHLMIELPMANGYSVMVLRSVQTLDEEPNFYILVASFGLVLVFFTCIGMVQIQSNLQSRAETRKKFTEDLQRRDAESRAIIESAFMGVVTLGKNGTIESVNTPVLDLFEYDQEDIIGEPSTMLLAEEYHSILTEALSKLQMTLADRKSLFNGEVIGWRRSGQHFPAELTITIITLADERKLLLGIRDLSAEKEAQEQLLIAAEVITHATEGILVTDPHTNILSINPAVTRITGYESHELIGKKPTVLQSGRQDAEFYKVMWDSLNSQGNWTGEIWNRRKDGSLFPEQLSLSAIKDKNRVVTHYVAIISDITQRKQFEEELTFRAHHDALTGLPNRTLLVDNIQKSLARARRRKALAAVMFLDLDGFKAVNDELGHAIGDELLIEVSERLKDCLRDEDTTARLGGDEFIMLLSEVAAVDEIKAIAERIIFSISAPYDLSGRTCQVSGSIGIAIYPDHGDDAETLLKAADNAMYKVKGSGKNSFVFADSDDDTVNTPETEGSV